MPKFRDVEEVEEVEDQDEAPDPAGDTDSDSDAPTPKAKAAKPAATKKKKPRAVEVAVEDEEKPAKKKAAKKAAKTKTEPKEAKERKPRKTIFSEDGLAFGEKSLAGRVFTLAARDEGVSVEKARKFLDANKKEKKGGTWVLGRIRKGMRKDGKVSWKVIDDGKISGILKVGKPRAKIAA